MSRDKYWWDYKIEMSICPSATTIGTGISTCNPGLLSFTTRESLQILFIMLAIVFILGLVGYFISKLNDDFFNKDRQNIIVVTPTIIKSLATTTIGSSKNGVVNLNNGLCFTDEISCSMNKNTVWKRGTDSTSSCQCIIPFFGEECNRESYDSKYDAIGIIDETNIESTVINSTRVDGLSFSTETMDISLCTKLCDTDCDCVGVLYQEVEPTENEPLSHTCTIYTNPIVIQEGVDIEFSCDKDSNLYMKNGNKPQFKDKVFLYNDRLPLRYWLQDDFTFPGSNSRVVAIENFHSISIPAPTELGSFKPSKLVNDTGCASNIPMCPFGNKWTGILYNGNTITDFSDSNLKTIIQTGTTDDIKIINPGETTFTVPSEWDQLKVIFVDATELN